MQTCGAISYEAYELCGTPGTGKVFKGLKRSMINSVSYTHLPDEKYRS